MWRGHEDSTKNEWGRVLQCNLLLNQVNHSALEMFVYECYDMEQFIKFTIIVWNLSNVHLQTKYKLNINEIVVEISSKRHFKVIFSTLLGYKWRMDLRQDKVRLIKIRTLKGERANNHYLVIFERSRDSFFITHFCHFEFAREMNENPWDQDTNLK